MKLYQAVSVILGTCPCYSLAAQTGRLPMETVEKKSYQAVSVILGTCPCYSLAAQTDMMLLEMMETGSTGSLELWTKKLLYLVHFAANLQILFLQLWPESVSATKMMLVEGSRLSGILPSPPCAGGWSVVVECSILGAMLARRAYQCLLVGTMASQPVFSASCWFQGSTDVLGSFLDCQDVSHAS